MITAIKEKTRLFILNQLEQNALRFFLVLGFAVRLIAVFFSAGYGMHDDHFCVIEPAQSWVYGEDGGWWFKNLHNPNLEEVTLRSFFYPSWNYLIFWCNHLLGIDNPKVNMFFIRLFHALLSMSVVYYGFKISEQLTSKQNQYRIGFLLALFWLFPYTSVRNLLEVVCIPFLMYSVYRVMIPLKKYFWSFFLAGLIGAVAVSIRMQTAIFLGGIMLVLFYQKKIREAFLFGIGMVLTIAIIDGGVGWYFYDVPFGHIVNYVKFNALHGDVHTQGHYTQYIELLIGLFLTMGVCYLIGFFFRFKNTLMVFFPTFLFLLIHTLISNKQERFLFSVLPFYIIVAVIGWAAFYERYILSKKWQTIISVLHKIFWVLNILLLIVFATYYTKKSRVEAMYYFYGKKDVKALVFDYSNIDFLIQMPQSYAANWCAVYYLYDNEKESINAKENYYVTFRDSIQKEAPQYILFYNEDKLNERVAKAKTVFPNLHFETKIEGSFLDWLIHTINPVNDNPEYYIYKTNI